MIVFDPTRTEPHWKAGAATYLEGILREDDLVVEWGAGASTKWLAERVGVVVSIEHDVAWAKYVRELCDGSLNVFVLLAEQFGASYLEAAEVGVGLRSARIVWIVDGWQRAGCLDRAYRRGRAGDLVVADDVLDYLSPSAAPSAFQSFSAPHPSAGRRVPLGTAHHSIYNTRPETSDTWIWTLP